MKFRTKSVAIDAVQFTKALRDSIVLDGVECPTGVRRGATTWNQASRKVWSAHFYMVTPGGRMAIELGDWIITDAQGQLSLCKPDVFESAYVAIESVVTPV